MSNRRMISADLFEDDYIYSVDYVARFAWIGLIVSCADDQGRFLDNPAIIYSKIFALDNDITIDKVESIISGFADAGKIVRYQINNKKIIQIVNWWKYQTPSWASPSKYPPPEGWIDRVKCHKQNKKIEIINWDKEGGFQHIHNDLSIEQDNGDETDEEISEHSQLHSQLHTDIHNQLHSQIDSTINEMRRDEIRRDEINAIENDLSDPEKSLERKPKNKESLKKSYGEFNNVTLTDDEYRKLQERFPSCYSDWIEKLSTWKESKGKRTKSDYATILNWDRMEKEKKPDIKNELEGWILR